MNVQELDGYSKNFFELMNQKFTEGRYRALINPKMTRVYALEMSNQTVKIGKTKNFERRIRIIASSSGLDVVNYHYTDYVHHIAAAEIETNCHKTFDIYRVKGEYFKITFAEACAELDKYSDYIIETNRKFFEEDVPRIKRDYENYLASIPKNNNDHLIKDDYLVETQKQTSMIRQIITDIKLSSELVEKIFNVTTEIAQEAVIATIEKNHKVDLSEFKNLLPPAEHEIGYLTPTQIAKEIGKSAQYINKKLLELKFQEKDGHGSYILTDKGKDYGEAIPFERNGHSGYQIKWLSEVISLFN